MLFDVINEGNIAKNALYCFVSSRLVLYREVFPSYYENLLNGKSFGYSIKADHLTIRYCNEEYISLLISYSDTNI